MTDRLADECHGYDLEGYPVELSIFDISPRIATKLARCATIAQAQRNGRVCSGTTEDYLIRAALDERFFGPATKAAKGDGRYPYWQNLNA